MDLDPPYGAQYPVLIRIVKTSIEPTATAGSKQLTVAPQPEYFMAVWIYVKSDNKKGNKINMSYKMEYNEKGNAK